VPKINATAKTISPAPSILDGFHMLAMLGVPDTEINAD